VTDRSLEAGTFRKFQLVERPVSILTRNSALKFFGEVTVAPITSTVRGIPTEVILDNQAGMKTIRAINFRPFYWKDAKASYTIIHCTIIASFMMLPSLSLMFQHQAIEED